MQTGLKHYFVPHEGNDHQPHLLRPRIIAGLAALVLVLEGAFMLGYLGTGPTSMFLASLMPDVLVSQTNAQRATVGDTQLANSPLLAAAAQAKADDMAAKGYFAHNSPDGRAPWDWISATGYQFSYAGENLAVDFSDSSDVTQAWMNSPGHRANILNQNYTQIGIATAKGYYNGHSTTFVVEMFGRPAATAVATSAPAPEATITGPVAGASVSPTPAPVTQPAPTKKPVVPSQPKPSHVAVTAQTHSASDMFIAVKNVDEPATTSVQTTGSTAPTVQPSLLDRIAGNPRTSVGYIFEILAALVGIALVLKVFRSAVHHPKLVLNGLLFILLIFATLTVNLFITQKDSAVHAAAAASVSAASQF